MRKPTFLQARPAEVNAAKSDARLSGLCLDAPDEEKVNRLFNQSEFLQGVRP